MTIYQLLKRISEILATNNKEQLYDFLLHTTENRGLFLRSCYCKSENTLKDEECGEITTVLVVLNKSWNFETTDYYENPDSKNAITKLKMQIWFDVDDKETLDSAIRKSVAAGFGSSFIKVNLIEETFEVLEKPEILKTNETKKIRNKKLTDFLDEKKDAENSFASYPEYLSEVKCWDVTIDGRTEQGELSYVLGELCRDGLLYRYNNGKQFHGHSHSFEGVLKALVSFPASFSVEGFENDYSEQELRLISKSKEVLLQIKPE